ncbi:hypothetical protein [Methylosinus sp. PW1]|uniref:hypothetical protein n=1 Tax=Methylosinus sp. PW1 TaxID=107636 RepID=UPI000B1BE668|nr:hypothetical protein [Methylosinus sp. PW1]
MGQPTSLPRPYHIHGLRKQVAYDCGDDLPYRVEVTLANLNYVTIGDGEVALVSNGR